MLQKSGHNKIADSIIIRSNKKQVTKFNGHCFCYRNRITAKNNDPKKIDSCPENAMIYDGLTFQNKYLSKVVTTCWFYILLHHAGKILDKRVFNQVNSIDAVKFLQHSL